MSGVSDDIRTQFISKLQSDPELKKILKGIKENGGDYSDAEKYASRAGQLLTAVLQANISEGNFPDGGIGMNSIAPEFDRSNAMNIAKRMSNYESFEDAAWMLEEPIQSAALGVTDDTLRKNADFQYKSGMKPKIVRTCEPDACKWCQNLADVYDYEDVKDRFNPVWQRHNNCYCEITYEPGEGRTDHVSPVSDDEAKQERIAFAENENKDYTKKSDQHKEKNMQRAMSGDNIGSSLKTPRQRIFETFIREYGMGNFDVALLDNSKVLGDYTPASMKATLERIGYNVTTLTRSDTHNNRLFEDGGGYKILFGGNGTFRYHPEEGSHHFVNGKPVAYYRLSRQETQKWYTLDGEEFDGPSSYRRR